MTTLKDGMQRPKIVYRCDGCLAQLVHPDWQKLQEGWYEEDGLNFCVVCWCKSKEVSK